MNMTNWIDTYIKEIQNDKLFKKYFSESEVDQIEDSKYLFNPDLGIDIVLTEDLMIKTIHLFSGKIQNTKEYKDEIPFGFKFSMSRSEIKSTLGESNKNGGGHSDILGYVPVWDKYYLDNCSLHFQYSKDEKSIELITLGSLKLEAYFNG